jgi:hypothetical protein
VKPLQPTITGNVGSIEETQPLDATCTTTGSRPKATLQWTLGRNNVTSNATERFSHITASDTYTVISDLKYSVGKSEHGQVLICKAVNVAASSDVQTSITLNVKCKLNKHVFILLHKKLSTILIQFKEYKCTINTLFVWIENPIWASTQKKDMTRSVWNFIFMMKVFSETTEPFKCKLLQNVFFLHQSNVKVSEWVIA